MRKHKLGIIGVIFTLTIAMMLFAMPQVYASEECKESDPERYGISVRKANDPGKFIVVQEESTCSNPASGYLKKTYNIVEINNTAVQVTDKLGAKGKSSVTFAAGFLPRQGEEYVSVKLQSIEAKPEDVLTITIEYVETVETAGSSGVKTVSNPRYYENQCISFRNQAGATGTAKYKFYKGSVPECFKTTVAQGKITNVTNVTEKIQKTNDYWTNQSNPEAAVEGFYSLALNQGTKVSDLSKTICLTCDYKFVKTSEANYYDTGYNSLRDGTDILVNSATDYYLNKKYYYTVGNTKTDQLTYTYNYAVGDTKTVTQDACERKCTEAVQLEYGPPVASKAGLCFEYKVKVTSSVVCSATFVADEPVVPTSACNPAPRCTHNKKQLKQAGPPEEFESCVQKCDGGKYSEKCSLKCYKQVYGSVSTKLALNYENAAATKLSSTNSYTIADCLKDNKDYYGCYSRNTSTINWHALVNYDSSGNEVSPLKWNDRNALGRWYLDRNDAHGNNYDKGGYDISGIKACTNKTYCGDYIADSNGFYRANYDGTTEGLCSDPCVWTGCKSSDYLNPGSIAADEERNMKIYEDAKNACLASNTCETHQATFSISINYDVADEEGNTTITRVDFPYTSEADSMGKGDAASNMPKKMAGITPGTTPTLSNDSIILNRDGCYKDKNSVRNYMTEWSFPGTYIHNKTGEISFKEQSGDGWYYDDQKFCMPLDAESVNTKWWEWYKLGKTCYTDAEIQNELKGKTGTSNGYNIVARTRNFGKFKWNFDIKCFYALRNETCNVQANGCCGTNKKENNGVMNYTFRTIDKANVFPNALEPGLIDPTKRAIGFNWTDKAKSNKNEDYEIYPSALIEHIESNAASLYDPGSESDNLDYRFHLTPADLAKIRAYNDNHAYASWDGEVDKENPINGIFVYQSNLFRDTNNGASRVLNGESIIKVGELGKNNQGNKPRGIE